MLNAKQGILGRCATSLAAFSLVVSAVVVPPSLPEFVAYAAKGGKFDDNCKNLRAPFSKIKNQSFKKSIIGGIIGGIVGAVVGSQIKTEEVVVDKDGNKRVKRGNRALEGAGAGFIVGAGVGYLSSLEQARQDRAALQAALNKHYAERTQYSDLDLKLADLGNCRTKMLFDIEQSLVRGDIDVKEAKKRLAAADKWIAEDDKIIAKAAKLETESITAYAQAVAVAEGESADTAKDNGAAMVERYAGESAAYASTVDVTYDVPPEVLANAPVRAARPAEPVEQAPEAPILGDAFVSAKSGARVRSAPNQNAEVLGAIAYRTRIKAAASEVDGWSMVEQEALKGFVASTLISLTRPAAVVAAPKKASTAKQPRPDLAPGKIEVRKKPRAPADSRAALIGAIADGNSFKQTRNASQAAIRAHRESVDRLINVTVQGVKT